MLERLWREVRAFFTHPAVWLALALYVLSYGGAKVLTSPVLLGIGERDRTAYGERPYWQAHLDAINATCGAGLFMYDPSVDYTAAGRWVLTGLGLCGAMLYLAAARQAARRIWHEGIPPLWMVLAAFAGTQALMIAVAALTERLYGNTAPLAEGGLQAVTSFSSLAWARPGSAVPFHWVYIAVGLVGALGWPVWLLPWRRMLAWRAVAVTVVTYFAFLALAAGLIAALELPRGMPAATSATDDRLQSQPNDVRYLRSLHQTAAAAGSGLATEALGARGVSDPTKITLAGVILVGGLGGSPGGGIKWPMVLWSLIGLGALLGFRTGRSLGEQARRCILAGVATTVVMVAWTLVVTFGLLIIEARIGSRFQTPPTFADAVLDASSAVAGAGLSSGLTRTITATSLSSGIQHGVDEYQYGMTWLMLAIFIGRVLPVLVLARVGRIRLPKRSVRQGSALPNRKAEPCDTAVTARRGACL